VKPLNSTLSSSGTTIFEAMSALAREHSAVNLGQGFPDDAGPLALREAAAEYVVSGHNQYPPMMGTPALRQAVAAHAKRFYDLGRDRGLARLFSRPARDRRRSDRPRAGLRHVCAGDSSARVRAARGADAAAELVAADR
jgi:hypothetical protein